jgi:hypothetical protein
MYKFQHPLCIEHMDGNFVLKRIICVDNIHLIAVITNIRSWMMDFNSSGNL